MPRRMRESSTKGKVLVSGPDRNADMITSSSDMVNDNIHPASSDGRMSGSVMSKYTRSGVAPRSRAASVRDASIDDRRAETVSAT